MMKGFPSSVELLELYRARYEMVWLVPKEWGVLANDKYQHQDHVRDVNLGICRGDSIPDLFAGSPYFNLKTGGIRFKFEYDPSSPRTLFDQLNEVVSMQVAEILQDLRFRLTPGEPFTSLTKGPHHTNWTETTIRLDPLSGQQIPGLVLPGHGVCWVSAKWFNFVPINTPEGHAILLRARHETALRAGNRSTEELRLKKTEFVEAYQAVPA